MKVGRLNDGRAYAAQYNPESDKVEIVDTDKDLGKLLQRIGWMTDDEDETENQDQLSTNAESNC